MRRRKFRTQEARTREKLRLTLVTAGIVLAILSLVLALAYATRLQSIRIQSITVTTDGVLDIAELHDILKEQLTGVYIGIIPKDSTLFLSSNTLTTLLEDSYPRIASADVARDGLSKLVVTVQERTPDALWCGDVVPPVRTKNSTSSDTMIWGNCYLVDTQGYIYAPAPAYSGTPFPRYYGSLTHAEPVGQSMTSADEFVRLQKLHTLMRESTFDIQALLLTDERDVELYLQNSLRIIVPRTEDVETIHNRLNATLTSDTIDMNRPIEYVDMRFGTKVFVKYSDIEGANTS